MQDHVFRGDAIIHAGQTLTSSQSLEKLCSSNCPETAGSLRYIVAATEPVEGFFQDGITELTIINSQNDDSSDDTSSVEVAYPDNEDVVIDERFLATSLTTSFSFGNNQPNGDSQEITSSRFTPEAIWDIANITMNDTSLYVGTQDLGELGLLSGDWVSISLVGSVDAY